MDRLTIEDIANVLVERNALTKDAARQFAVQLFAVVREGLERDRIIKVKGLGTFKIVDVEARESINVNTGARVLIDEHSKISFSPDTTMKELVNKPFSQFETVVINDGVTFDDMPTFDEEDEQSDNQPAELPDNFPTGQLDNQSMEQSQSRESEASLPDAIVSPLPEPHLAEPMSEQKTEQPSELRCEPVLEQRCEPASEQETEPVSEQEIGQGCEQEDAQSIEEDAEEEPAGDATKWIVAGVISLVLIVLAACAGYIYGLNKGRAEARAMQKVSDTKEPAPKPKSKDSVLAALHPEEPVTLDGTLPAADTAGAVKAKEVHSAAPKKEQHEQDEPKTFDNEKYEKMDSRVRTGAYRIVGVAQIVTVKKGETLKRISKTYLGDGMECYVEVINGLSSSSELKEGYKLKIPKLELKKRGK